MALTRKFLKALGIEDDKIDQIIEAHSETVTAIKTEKDDALSQVTELNTQLASKSKELEDAKNKDPYKEQLDKITKEFSDYKAGIVAKEAKQAKEAAYRNLLKAKSIDEKRFDAILKVTDLTNSELKDGKFADAEALAKSIDENWSDFKVVTKKEGANVPNPPDDQLDEKEIANLKAVRKAMGLPDEKNKE